MRDLEILLSQATSEQLEPLVAILDTNQCRYASKTEVINGIKWLYRNIFQSFKREVITEKSETYAEVLCSLLKKLSIECHPGLGCVALEEALIQTIFQMMWVNFTNTQRLDLEENFYKIIEESGRSKEWKQVGGIGGVMLAANMGGFSTYILASSALSAVSNIVNITFPFALYKAVSSTISVVIGPLGLLGLAIFGTYKLTGTNYQKLLPAAMYISMLRYELSLNPNRVIGNTVLPHDFEAKRGIRLY